MDQNMHVPALRNNFNQAAQWNHPARLLSMPVLFPQLHKYSFHDGLCLVLFRKHVRAQGELLRELDQNPVYTSP